MRRFFNPIVLLFLILSPLSVDAAEPIKIGFSLGLTGKYYELSDMQMKAFRLWEKSVNNRGGILGRNVELIIYDDKSDPETAKTLYEHLITRDKVDLLFAPYSSELTEAILPIAERYGYPIVSTGAASDKLWQKGYKCFFGLFATASRYSVRFLEMLVRYGFENIAIVYADDPFSKSIADGTKEWSEKFGLTVRVFAGFKKGTTDFLDIVKTAKQNNCEALVVCGHFDEAVDVRLSLKKINWHPKAYYASIGPSLSTYYKQLGSDVEYAFTSSFWENNSRYPGSQAFYEEFKKNYGDTPSYQAAHAFAGGELLEKAIKKARTFDRRKVREMLSTMEAMSIIGPYGVDKTGRQIRHSPFIIQWQRGKKEIVWPADIRTAKPVFK